jgi:hypothetical protein
MHPADSAPDRPLDTIPEAVSDAGDAPSSTDLPPAAAAEDGVDPLARQPGPLVEPALGLARLGNASHGLEDRAARR